MVEYGGGVTKGPAGQVGGGGGSPFDGGGDPFASIGNLVNDATNTLATLGPVEIVALLAAVFVGLMILRRAF